jgi:hemolysin III
MKPLLRGHFHQAMFFISLGACSLLIANSESSTEWLSTIIYSFGTLSMFGVSALYHRINWSPEKRALLKKLDHSGIYIMIAGTVTPITLMGLSEESGKTLLIIIWTIALFGVLQSIFFVNLPKIVSALIYILAGFIISPYLSELAPNIGGVNLWLLLAGGITYSLGALAYGFKRPAFNPKYFGYHELFHVMVSIAAILHFIVVYSLIIQDS